MGALRAERHCLAAAASRTRPSAKHELSTTAPRHLSPMSRRITQLLRFGAAPPRMRDPARQARWGRPKPLACSSKNEGDPA
jgi:hypothetical protein